MNPLPTKRTWHKQDVLYESLLGMARNLGPTQRLPTIQELCASMRVSTSTLNPVLRRLANEGAIVRRHGHGLFVSQAIHQKTIGVVVGIDVFARGFSPLWQLVLETARAEAGRREHRYQSYMDTAGGKEGFANHAHLVRDLEEKRLHGIFLVSAGNADEIQSLHQSGLPVVVFGNNHGVPVGTVNFDSASTCEHAVRELRAAGARRLALFGYVDAATGIKERFRAAVEQSGTVADLATDWAVPLYGPLLNRLQPNATREEWGYARMRALLAAGDRPDGVWIEDDTVTRGALMAIHQAGLRIGRDIWIATQSNKASPVLAPYEADLILVEFDPAEVVRAAFDMLDFLMTGRRPASQTVAIQPAIRKPTA